MSNFFSGVGAAISAPFLMVLGFMIWDDEWTKKNGSAFSLNMYKCNLTALWFLIAIIIMNVRNECKSLSTSCGTSPFWDTVGNIRANIDPFRNKDVKFLYASSTVGILIGDWTWIEGLKYLGARKVIVLDSLKPFLAAFAGWLFFDEKFSNPLSASFGLFTTVIGVVLVGFETETKTHDEHPSFSEGTDDTCDQESLATSVTTAKVLNDSEGMRAQTSSESYGIAMSIANVALHTIGASLTKMFGTEMTTWEINFIRFGFSGFCMLCIASILHVGEVMSRKPRYCQQDFSQLRLLRPMSQYESIPTTTGSTIQSRIQSASRWYALPCLSRASWLRVSLGVAFVSFLHPALTNYAMFQIPLALLLTLESIGPLYSLPLTLLMHKEFPSNRASLGAVLAVVGITLLSIQGRITR